MIRVLMVCMGNICRSPTAEAVMHNLVDKNNLSDKIEIQSAGTHSYHIGEQPDDRSIKSAKKRGFDLSSIKAQKVQLSDFYEYDYMLAMDENNLLYLQNKAPANSKALILKLLEFLPLNNKKNKTNNLPIIDVPDPYYTDGKQGFEEVLDLIESASYGFMQHLKSKHLS
jgi:protein-tyrosine phosphatase